MCHPSCHDHPHFSYVQVSDQAARSFTTSAPDDMASPVPCSTTASTKQIDAGPLHSCPLLHFMEYMQLRQLGLPIDRQKSLEQRCMALWWQKQHGITDFVQQSNKAHRTAAVSQGAATPAKQILGSRGTGYQGHWGQQHAAVVPLLLTPEYLEGRVMRTRSSKNTSNLPNQHQTSSCGETVVVPDSTPVPALRVTAAAYNISLALRCIREAYSALTWLNANQAVFPVIQHG